MERETKKLNLDFCELTIKSYLTWGESETIETVLLKGAKNISQSGVTDFDATILTEQKYVLLEQAITSVNQDGKDFKFNRDWFNNLKKEQGDIIIQKINEEVKKK
jgi:hypothetical protein